MTSPIPLQLGTKKYENHNQFGNLQYTIHRNYWSTMVHQERVYSDGQPIYYYIAIQLLYLEKDSFVVNSVNVK